GPGRGGQLPGQPGMADALGHGRLLHPATLTAGTRASRDPRGNALFRTENSHGQDRSSVGARGRRVPRRRRLRLADATAPERADPDPVRGRRRRLGGRARAQDRKSTRLNSSHVKNLVCRLLLEKKKTDEKAW